MEKKVKLFPNAQRNKTISGHKISYQEHLEEIIKKPQCHKILTQAQEELIAMSSTPPMKDKFKEEHENVWKVITKKGSPSQENVYSAKKYQTQPS